MIETTKYTKHTKSVLAVRSFLQSMGERFPKASGRARFVSFVCFVYFVVSSVVLAENVPVLKSAAFTHHVEHFNKMEDENVTNFISNAESWSWLQKNIPLFECPDREVEEMYYFRWWSFRKHLVSTTNGFVFTEFLTPVRHAGIFNTISCAAGFHVAEGRWLHDQSYLDDYLRFWLRGDHGKPQPHFHKYSSWLAAAAYDRYLVNQDRTFIVSLLDDFISDYAAWESERLPALDGRPIKESDVRSRRLSGLFWQYDVR